MAVGVLTECYQLDKERAHDLLIREMPTWGKTTLFAIADSEGNKTFMVQTASQKKLTRIWKGDMALDTANWKVSVEYVSLTIWNISF